MRAQQRSICQGEASRITGMHQRRSDSSAHLCLHQIENRRRSLAIARALDTVVLVGHRDAHQRQLDSRARRQVAVIRLRHKLTGGALTIRANRSREIPVRARAGDRKLTLSTIPDRHRDIDRYLRTFRGRRKDLGVVSAGRSGDAYLRKVSLPSPSTAMAPRSSARQHRHPVRLALLGVAALSQGSAAASRFDRCSSAGPEDRSADGGRDVTARSPR